MKKALASISMFLMAVIFTAGLYAGDSKEAKISTNMHCGSCKSKIESTLKDKDGINSVSADLASNMVTVKYDADKTNVSAIQKQIKDLGFSAEAKGESCSTDEKSCSTMKKVSDKKDCGSEKSCCKTKSVKTTSNDTEKKN